MPHEDARAGDALDALFDYARARRAHGEGLIGDAELAAVYVGERARAAAGPRFLQAARAPRPSLEGERGALSGALALFAERELYRIPRPVAAGLVAWAEGARRVRLLFHVPSARELLGLQARGERCVSLLDEGVPTAPHADGLAFAVHDLCHLEKFANPAHHAEQVGFFASMDRALADPRWEALEAGFDAEWQKGRDYVMADMNGSAAFLFVVLKSTLKHAALRRLGQGRGAARFDPAGERAFAETFEALLALFDFDAETREAARALSSRRDEAQAARVLVDCFRARGEARLSACHLA